MIKRAITTWGLNKDFLHNRMSFIAGPRQIGKTTTALNFLKGIKQEKNYFNWDSISLKQKFAKNVLFFKENLPPASKLKKQWIVFDEIHKYPKWKNLLKGYFDEYNAEIQFIITGSAKLDLFTQSGDSLVGRYFPYRMFPLGPKDIVNRKYDYSTQWNPGLDLESIPSVKNDYFNAITNLLNTSGFPEPFLDGTKDFYERWKDAHVSLLINEDLRDLTKIAQIKKLETLIFLLPERTGSPVSLNALKNTLECSHGSVKSWLDAFEMVFLVFSLSPYSHKISRSVLKEKKYYFWDWGLLDNMGQRFENFIAVQLLRAVTTWNEWGKGKFELHYLRTKDGLEVDFAVTKKNKIVLLVEAKISDDEPGKALKKIMIESNKPLTFQVINKKGFYKRTESDIMVIGVDLFLQILP